MLASMVMRARSAVLRVSKYAYRTKGGAARPNVPAAQAFPAFLCFSAHVSALRPIAAKGNVRARSTTRTDMKRTTQTEETALRLPPDLTAAIRQAAARDQRSTASMVRKILSDWLSSQGSQEVRNAAT
jgi:hypothetical protein